MAARLLAEQGHAVVLHARNEPRARDTRGGASESRGGDRRDLSTLAAMRGVADEANRQGRFDAVIHNVGLGYREARRVETVDGLSQLWAVNVLARATGCSARPAALRYRGDEPALDRDRDRDRSRQTRRAPARSSRMAFVQLSCRAGDNHPHVAPAEMPGIEPGRKRLAVHPRELVVEPRLPLLRHSSSAIAARSGFQSPRRERICCGPSDRQNPALSRARRSSPSSDNSVP